MDKIKRFIECYVDVTTCNFRCHYCYITQTNRWRDKPSILQYDVAQIKRALSKERLGGICLINLCAGGETLISKEIIDIMKVLLEEGHYVSVVTNGSLTKRIDEILTFPSILLERLFIKFSFHYLELLRLNKLDVFFNNIEKTKASACSFTVEITPNDELIPYIDKIKKISNEQLGTLPHITIARNDIEKDIPILSKHSKSDFYRIWSEFASEMLDFKYPIFGEKRNEFCYAGDWSVFLNIYNGELRECYNGKFIQNIYENISEPIKFSAIGRHCPVAHCYNAHSFLLLGVIPRFDTDCSYSKIRNRVCADGSEWLKPSMKAFMSTKLSESNKEYSGVKKMRIECQRTLLYYSSKISRRIKKILQ